MPLYDYTVAQTSPYQRLQKECIGKLQFDSGDAVLCVGVGTGSEILSIMEMNGGVRITGIDTSPKALRRAQRKVLKQGKEITAIQMKIILITKGLTRTAIMQAIQKMIKKIYTIFNGTQLP